MKKKELIKKLKSFKEREGSCYCYIKDCGFYNSAFIIPILESTEDVVLHNGATLKEESKVYKTLTQKQFKKSILLCSSYENTVNIHKLTNFKNVVFDLNNDFYEKFK